MSDLREAMARLHLCRCDKGPHGDVRGRVVSESVIERAANAIYALDWGNHPSHLNAVTWNKAQERARAAVRVVLEHMEDE